MRPPRYTEPLLGAIFLSSTTTHLITSRRAAADERSRLTAQSTILTDLISRIRAGERIPEAEYTRLVALASSKGKAPEVTGFDVPMVDPSPAPVRVTGWKEVLLGRKRLPEEDAEQDEQARLEWKAAFIVELEGPDKTEEQFISKIVPAIEEHTALVPQSSSSPSITPRYL